MVLEQWGIKSTRDWGEIVYLMIQHEWMTSQENDRIQDFDNVYDFHTVFERDYQVEIPIIAWHGRCLARLSVQGYNSAADIDRLLGAWASLLPAGAG